VEGKWWFVYTFRDDIPIRAKAFPDRADALEAAGLSE
jgi:hypothetical protein